MAENNQQLSEGRFEIVIKRYAGGSNIERHNNGINDSELIALAEIIKAEALARVLKNTETEFHEKEMD